MKTKLMTMILAAGAMLGAWARTYTAADFGKVVCEDGSVYATAADASSAGKTARAMIAYVDGNYVLAIALADTSATGLLWGEAVESVGTWAADNAVAGGQWRLPSADDYKRIFSACGGSEYTASLAEQMEFSWGDIQTMLSSAGGTQLDDYNTYWLSDEASEGTAWGYRTNLQLFRSYSKSNYWCLARAVLAFGAARTYDKVQLWEGGPYWATTNIGAEKPEEAGYYFWWGDTVGYKRENEQWVASDGSTSNFSFESGNTPTYNKDVATLQSEGWITADGVLHPTNDAAHVQWGGEWRMPTDQEMDDLDNKCDWTLITTNGVYGFVVRGKGAYAPASIFLPCVGVGSGTSLTGVNSDGAYCSATLDRPSLSWSLLFSSAGWHNARSNRYWCDGCSIRPVQNAPAPANQWTSGDCTVTLDTETGTLAVCGPGAMADYTSEGDIPWFANRDDIRKIVVESGVTRIGDLAFCGSTNLVDVVISNGVTSIGNYVFYYCGGLTGVTIPDSVTDIGEGAFYYCSALTDVTIPNGVTSIADRTFQGCVSLTQMTIRKDVTNIGSYAFYKCAAMTDVYCHPNAANLTWGYARGDFKSDGSTKIHVKASQLAAYRAKFGESVRATFVGELRDVEFTTGGDADWFEDPSELGLWRSGAISSSESTWLEVTFAGSGSVKFEVKTSTESGWDWLCIYSDGDMLYQHLYSGEHGWTEVELWFDNAGTHTIKWEYSKDDSGSNGSDCVWMRNFVCTATSVTPDMVITEGTYFKATLSELGYDVPTNGTPYNVTAYGLPAGLKLKSNAAVTKKDKKGKKIVVTPANVEWWIEGVPTAALDYATNPAYLVITVDGKTETLPLSLGVEAQKVTELEDLALGQSLNEQFYLPGVTNGWTVSGLPAGLKYTAKLVTTTKKKGKKIISVTTNALPYSVYGKTTKAGLFTITAKKKTGSFYETLKYRVLVTPAGIDGMRFGEDLTNITTMAYVPLNWNLATGEADPSVPPVPFLPSAEAIGGLAKVTGLPPGLTFAAVDTYADKKRKKRKQYGQTIVGTPTKPGTYVVTFTKNAKEKVKGKVKTVAKTAQVLWTVVANDAELSLGFNTAGGEIKDGSVGLNYGDLLAFSATDGATVTASGLPKGITLANLGDGQYAFKGFTAKAGTYLVTVTATLNGKTVTQRIALKVDGLPSWAKGTYNGIVTGTGNGEPGTGATNGLATVTVSSVGKISGKFSENGTNWTFSASSYTGAVPGTRDACPYQEFTCSNVVAKYAYKVTEKDKKGKKQTVTKYLTREFTLDVSETEDLNPARGMVCMEEIPPEGAAGTAIEAYQNLWGQSGYKALGKKLFYTSKKVPYKTWASIEADGLGEYDTLSMKVTPAGVATATYKFFKGTFDKKGKPQYATYACTTVLHPETSAEAGPDGFGAMMYLYFPSVASAGFKKYAEIVRYPFTDRKANVPDKAAIDAAKWCAGEYLGYGYAEFPGEDWLYGIFRVSVGADLAFTGTFEAIDGGVADFSGKLVKNVADGVAITVSGTPMSMGVKAMSKPYGKSKYGEIFAWSEAEEGQPNIHIDRAWQNIWTSVGMASARPKIAPGTTKTVDLAGAEIYRYPMGDYVEGDSFTYTFAEDGTVSVTGQVFGVPVDTTTAIAVETESGGTCDCILTFMINGRVFQQNFTMPSGGTVTSESISLDVSSSNFGIING